MSETKMEPCPFCGSKAELVARENGNFDVGCDNPLCYGWVCHDNNCSCEDGYFDRQESIDAWNTRADQSNLSETEEYIANLLCQIDEARELFRSIYVRSTSWKRKANGHNCYATAGLQSITDRIKAFLNKGEQK